MDNKILCCTLNIKKSCMHVVRLYILAKGGQYDPNPFI